MDESGSNPTPTVTSPNPRRYSFRKSILEKERHYSIGDEALTIEEEDMATERVPFRDIQQVHLRFHRTKQRDYYQCILKTASKGKILLQNVHFAGFADFEDRRDTYVPFIRALHTTLAGYPGQIRFEAGSWLTYGFTILMIAVVVILGIGALFGGLWYLTLAAAFVGWRMLPIVPRAKPNTYTPTTLPAGLLPE